MVYLAELNAGFSSAAKQAMVYCNRPYSYSRYWTGTSFQLRLMQRIVSNANHLKLFLIIFLRISLHCRLVPVQYREYKYGLFLSFDSDFVADMRQRKQLGSSNIYCNSFGRFE